MMSLSSTASWVFHHTCPSVGWKKKREICFSSFTKRSTESLEVWVDLSDSTIFLQIFSVWLRITFFAGNLTPRVTQDVLDLTSIVAITAEQEMCQPGSHTLCTKTLLDPHPPSSSELGKGTSFDPQHLCFLTGWPCFAYTISSWSPILIDSSSLPILQFFSVLRS